MLAAIAEAVEAAKAEKNRIAAVKQHSGGCDNKLTDPEPTKKPERVTQKAAEILAAIAEAVEAEAKRKMAAAKIGNENANKEKQACQLIDRVEKPKQPERVTQKAAEIFNTNRTYISEAQKLKEEKQTVQFVEPSVKDNSKLATQKAAEILQSVKM